MSAGWAVGPDLGSTSGAVSADLLARVTWSRIAEPGERRATGLVRAHGAARALEVVAASRAREDRRYQDRLVAVDPRPSIDLLHRMGGRLVGPDDPEWPPGLDVLVAPPFCLWVRGPLNLAEACRRSVAIVGSRASTPYGEDMAGLLAEGVAERGFTIVSGAAYGIDARAQNAALATEGATVSVLAGGVDRPYPRANEEMLATVAAHGAVVSEVPIGAAPMRNRFLQRNRMIATMTLGTVVVEAALRSGALNTARWAADHNLPVGVVPGPVTSMVSAGCHQALREGWAVTVTDAAEVVELVGSIGADVAPRPAGPVRSDWDDLDPDARRVLDALPKTTGSALDKVALVAGVDVDAARAALGQLALLALAERDGRGWRRSRPPRRGGLPPEKG